MSSVISDEDAYTILRTVVAAHDDCQLWPKKSVERAKALFMRDHGNVPSLGKVVSAIGEERARRLLPDIINLRKFDNVRVGYGSPCHYCGSNEDLEYCDFALMRVASSKVKFGQTLATAVLSAATLPLFGAGVLRLPGQSLNGEAIFLRLVVCKLCCRKEGNIFGFLPNEQRASRHPLWNDFYKDGFTKFLRSDKMPDEFQGEAWQYQL